jgi:hypothetical protein
MKTTINRQTVDLGKYPDLIVIYLGMRVNRVRGLRTLFRMGAMIREAVDAKPDGLLLHENLIFSILPPHAGMRQYWRDFDSMERFARALPHREWWRSYLRDSGGTGFWHETYCMRGGIEAVYDDLTGPLGLLKFAPAQPARGAMFSARKRLHLGGAEPAAPAAEESELYD